MLLQPQFGGWKALTMDRFKTVNVVARKVEDPGKEFEYQVVFAHAALKQDRKTRKWTYPEEMMAWVKTLAKGPEF